MVFVGRLAISLVRQFRDLANLLLQFQCCRCCRWSDHGSECLKAARTNYFAGFPAAAALADGVADVLLLGHGKKLPTRRSDGRDMGAHNASVQAGSVHTLEASVSDLFAWSWSTYTCLGRVKKSA